MKGLIKSFGRNVVFPIACGLGMEHLLSKSAQSKRLVLSYHGVDAQSSMPYSGRHLSSKVFEKHLQYFQKHFDVVSVDEMFRSYREDPSPKRPKLTLTFDDGYLNNYRFAYPLLERYQMPATFYVSAICIEDPDYVIWADYLDLVRVLSKQTNFELDGHLFVRSGKMAMINPETKESLYSYIKKLPVGKRDEVIQSFRKEYDFDRLRETHQVDYFRLMNSEQVAEIARSKYVDIGTHGYRHYNLANIDGLEMQRELTHSKALLESVIDQPIQSIAFPDGNYNAAVKAQCMELGIDQMFSEQYLLEADHEDPHILPRISVSGTTNYYSQIIYIHQRFKDRGF